MKLEISISPLVTRVKSGDYSCKIEKGDIRQGGITYKDQVRRLTLTLPDGSQLIHETKGSSCDVKARNWLAEKTNGSITTY